MPPGILESFSNIWNCVDFGNILDFSNVDLTCWTYDGVTYGMAYFWELVWTLLYF